MGMLSKIVFIFLIGVLLACTTSIERSYVPKTLSKTPVEELYQLINKGTGGAKCYENSSIKYCQFSYEEKEDLFGVIPKTYILTVKEKKEERALFIAHDNGYNEEGVNLIAYIREDAKPFPDKLPEYLVRSYPKNKWKLIYANPMQHSITYAHENDLYNIPALLKGSIKHMIDETINEAINKLK